MATSRKRTRKKATKSASTNSQAKIVKDLSETCLLLQKKNVELLTGMNALTKRVDKLVNVFEEASKHVMEVGEDKKILELADKLEKLLEQNKTIAGGLLMLEKYVRERAGSAPTFGKPLR